MRVTRQALRVLYRLSIRIQYNAQSPWQAFLIIQRAVGLMEDVEEESEDAGQALAKELKLSMESLFLLKKASSMLFTIFVIFEKL